jgi:hypothetical protein
MREETETGMKVVFGRKRIEFATLEADADFQRLPEPAVMVGTGLPERGVAFAFRDWKELLKFSARTKAADKIAAIDERRRKLSRRNGEDMTGIAERHRRKAARIEAELRELAARTGLALDSKELLLKATTEADPLEGAIFDPAVLFMGIGFIGLKLYVYYPGIPDLGWFNFNDRVSAVKVVGIVVLYRDTFFRGPSRIFVGIPYFEIPNLLAVGFNNTASSVQVD